MRPDPTSRFSSRVADYVRFRPSYPAALIGKLEADCGFAPSWEVVDVGSGTGILSRLFLDQGNRVSAVEPNREMRLAAERLMADHPLFTSLEGRAETIPLRDGSVELVAAGQAFHWFEPEPARREFRRVLKPGGWVLLVWNERRKTSTPFLCAYEELLLEFATDYRQVDHSMLGIETIEAFFGQAPGVVVFDNSQIFDLPGLTGRLLSSSYAPGPNHTDHRRMLEALREIFLAHRKEGRVTFEYDTRAYYGRLDSLPPPARVRYPGAG